MTNEQLELCARVGAACEPPSSNLKIGIAANVGTGLVPLNGLRHPQTPGTSGWYVWAGEELSSDPQFFQPMHIGHLTEFCPEILRFLGLPPGWRFLKAPGVEDVWFDTTLLRV